MVRKQIYPGLWCLQESEANLRVFGSASFTESGRSYNAYLMDTGEGFLLLGAMPHRFMRSCMTEVGQLAGDDLKWALFFGTDDDREAAKAVLQKYPEAVILSGTNSLYKMTGFVEDFRKIEIRTNRTLTLGKKKLSCRVLQDKFATPLLYVLDTQSGTLFTADAFGAVCAAKAPLVSALADKSVYWKGVAHYLADISAANREKTMKQAVSLVRENAVQRICPAQGPVMDAELEQLLALYEAEPKEKKDALAVGVIYAPGNYVAELADSIASGLTESGNVKVSTFNLDAINRDDVLKKLPQMDAYLFGTAEIDGDAAKAIWDIVTSLRSRDCEGKLAAVFTSTNSISGAADKLRQRLNQLGCDLNGQDHLVQGKPGAQEVKNAYEYGFGFGCMVQKIPNPHKPKLVKCLVCGEYFDASLGTCPVCGVGLDQCVPADEEAVTYKNDTNRSYLILGGGIAAVSAAEAIRSRDETGSITMLSAENYLPINRPMLTKDLQTIAKDPDSIQVHTRQWYEERKIDLKLGVRALTLNAEAKTVTASDGETYIYDKLIYATGAECFVPPFEGHDKPGVITIRHLWDSQKLQTYLKTAKNAVVIGGGVLGLEAASELMRSGVRVTVLEATPQIIGRQVDAGSAARLKASMESLGVACYEGVSIAAIEGDGQVSGVRLADGRVFLADFVVVSCGNRGNVQVAKEAGITVDRSIVVNQRMETSAIDVYACGDCCQFDGVNFQLWQEASNQGRVAGANAAGEAVTYANQLLGLSLEGFGTALFAMGDPGKKPDVPYKMVETVDGVRNRAEKYWFFGERLEGAVIIGAPEKTAEVSQAVSTHARYSELF